MISFLLQLFNHDCSLIFGVEDLFTGEGPLDHFFLFGIHHVVFNLVVEVHEDEGVFDEILLDGFVKRSVCGEAGSVVDFQDGRLEVFVQNYIEPENFEAHVVG